MMEEGCNQLCLLILTGGDVLEDKQQPTREQTRYFCRYCIYLQVLYFFAGRLGIMFGEVPYVGPD